MSDAEDQSDEVLAVTEILPHGTFEVKPAASGGHTGSVEVCVDLVDPVKIAVEDSFNVRYLPPIRLDFTLPHNYPSEAIPEVNVSCVWLTEQQLENVKNNLKNIAQENLGTVVLFLWINFLQQEVLEAIQFDNTIDLLQVRSSKAKNTDRSKGQKAPSQSENVTTTESNSDKSPSTDKPEVNPEAKDADEQVDQLAQQLTQSGIQNIAVEGGKEIKKRLNGIVESWNLDRHSGIIIYDGGIVSADMNDIMTPNLSKLEVSLAVGEEVEFELIRDTNRSRAVNITGPNGTVVQGNVDTEIVTLVVKDAYGQLEKWNARSGEGMLRTLLSDGAQNDAVYVYHTSLHFDTKDLSHKMKNLLLRYNIVDCKRYGKIAQYVRIQDMLVGTVRMFREDDKKGWIKVDKHEILFNSDDIVDSGKITQGAEVCFSLKYIKRKTQAVSVRLRSNQANLREADKGKESNGGRVEKTKQGPSKGSANETERPSTAAGDTKDCDTSSVCDQNKTKPVCDDVSGDCNPRLLQPQQSRESAQGLKILTARLREYNNMKEEEMFAVSCFNCLVCFSEKTGQNCVRFAACSHVYCKECMAQYFEIQIKNGQVKNLTCPTDDCKTQALPTQVEELVSAALFKKYENMLLETTLESMVDVITCPRVFCQCPTVIDRKNNMGECPACQLSFCIYCMATYHGVSPCKIKTKEHKAILDKYNQGTDDDKAFLEKRYGKVKLQQLMANVLSETYLSENAQNCPHCNAPIEKNDGCNKMTCWRCATNFCWLCGEKLPASNPYSHFNLIGGNCYGNLFQGVDPIMDDDQWEDEFFIL